MSFYTPEDGAQEIQRSSLPKFTDILIDLKVKDEEKKVVVRPIGFPYKYTQYSPFKPVTVKQADGSVKKDRAPQEFADSDVVKGFYRRGVNDDQLEDYGLTECPYAAGNYCGQDRWAQNVLEIFEDGTYAVKVLDGPKSLWEEFWKWQRSNRDRNIARNSPGKYVENLGAEKSHECEITASPSRRGAGKGADYIVAFLEETTITDEQIEALERAGKPTDEELAQIRKTNADRPSIMKAPDWMFYGYPLKKLFKPQLPRTEAANGRSDNEGLDDTPVTSTAKASGRAQRETGVAASPVAADSTDEEW
jgi:hypothetical protein